MTGAQHDVDLSVLQADRISAICSARAAGRPAPFPQICPMVVADIAARLDISRLARALGIAAPAAGALQASIRSDGGSQWRTEAVPETYELALPADFRWEDVHRSVFVGQSAQREFEWNASMADVGWAVDGDHTILMLRADQLISDLRSIQLFFQALSHAYQDLAL